MSVHRLVPAGADQPPAHPLVARFACDRPSAADENTHPEFAADAVAGLSRQQKAIPAKYLYDRFGSMIFEAICDQPEYYPSRTEAMLLETAAPDIAAAAAGERPLIEFGSGASSKTRILLDAMPQIGRYIPIDISASALQQARIGLESDYPGLSVEPLHADFTRLSQGCRKLAGGCALGFFPGTTIGNFTPVEAFAMLSDWRRLLGRGSLLLLGVDLRKDPRVLVPAYDDAAGVTAAFNLNLLTRMNRELRADFDLSLFDHRAVWNAAASRIEMHLVSLCRQIVTVAGRVFAFAEGETIHTENSYKYVPQAFVDLARGAGWAAERAWLSPDPTYGLFLFKARNRPAA